MPEETRHLFWADEGPCRVVGEFAASAYFTTRAAAHQAGYRDDQLIWTSLKHAKKSQEQRNADFFERLVDHQRFCPESLQRGD